MKIILNLSEIGSCPRVDADRARVAFDGMMSIYEQLPGGVLEALEMARFAVKEDVREDVSYPFVLEVTVCKKMQGPSSTSCRKHIHQGFNVDMVKIAMLAAISELMNGLVYDSQQRQRSAVHAFQAFKSSQALIEPEH